LRKKVIIDCDPGIDDSLAVMLAINSPELEILGITIVAGNSPVDMGYQNILKVLSFMNRLDIPVYKGAEKPLRKKYVNALDTHGADGLGESFLPEVSIDNPTNESALSFFQRTLADDDCSVIALGPLTNLAQLIQASPDKFLNIRELISMGGNFRSHGNCSPVAEYNYWEDPDAAHLVYQTLYDNNKQIKMVGLDVTRKIVLTPTILSYMKRVNPRVGDFVQKITKFYFDFHWEWEHIIGCVINDPLAVMSAIEPGVLHGFSAYTDIVTGGLAEGESIVDSMNFYRKSANAEVCNEVNIDLFWKMFLTRMLGEDIKDEIWK
jgi:purine nucleosidase